MKYILIVICLCWCAAGYAQSSINIGSGMHAVASGALRTVMGTGSFVNNGIYIDNTGHFIMNGPVNLTGSGTTDFYDLTIDNTGVTTFSSQASVLHTATLAAGSLETGNNNLYIRLDLNGSANMVVEGVLTGTVQGLVTKATNTTGSCPSFTSTLSLNISGSVMEYQWQSSPDNSLWTNISGATTATYPATVNSNAYYRCNLTTTNSSYNQATPGKLLELSGPPPAITFDPSNTAACSDASARFYLAASDDPVSYIWEVSTDGGGTWNTVDNSGPYSGYSTDTLTIDPASGLNGNYYRGLAISYCGTSLPSAAALLTVHTQPSVSAGSDATICAGSGISLSGSGASSYTWDHGITNGVAFTPDSTNIYTVTGTDVNGCSNTAQVTIGVHYPVLNPSGAVTFCQGDSVTLTAPAGSGYIWKRNGVVRTGATTNILEVANVGSYTVTYTDNICGLRTTAPAILSRYPLTPLPEVTPALTTICPGDNASLSGPAGYEYQWSFNTVIIPGATNQNYSSGTAGSYQLTVTDTNGCTKASRAAKIKVRALPNTDILIKRVNPDGSILVQGVGGTVTYQWILENNPISGATDKYYTATLSGNYSLQVSQPGGCTDISPDTFMVINYTGLRNVSNAAMEYTDPVVAVQPNPSTGVFHITSDIELRAVVVDLQGKLIQDIEKTKEIDLTEQAPGIYMLQLLDGDGEMVKSERLIRQ